jgi:hypothetical protein
MQFQRIDHIAVRTIGHNRHFPQAAEIVDNQVMSNTHHPMDEFVLILVQTRIDCVDHFIKSILKDVVSDILSFTTEKI